MKRLIVLLFVSLLIVLSGCNNIGSTTLYFLDGHYPSYIEGNNTFVLIDNEDNFYDFLDEINVDENRDLDLSYKDLKQKFKKNEIGFILKDNNKGHYKYLLDNTEDAEELFKNNRLVLCTVTTMSTGYQAVVNLKRNNEGNASLVLDKFNNFKGYGDDEIRTYQFFVVISKDIENFTITLDGEAMIVNIYGSR